MRNWRAWRGCITVAVLGAVTSPAAAEMPDGSAAGPVAAISREHSLCAAYSYVAAECLGRLPDGEELSDRYHSVARRMYALGYALAKEVGAEDDAYTDRFRRHLEEVKTNIGHSCGRVTELAPLYGASCKRLAERPGAVFDDLLEGEEPVEAED